MKTMVQVMLKKLVIVVKITNYYYDEVMVILLWPPIQYRGATSIFGFGFGFVLVLVLEIMIIVGSILINKNCCFFVWSTRLDDSWILKGQKSWFCHPDLCSLNELHSILIDKNCWFCFFNYQKSWSTRIVDSGHLKDQKCFF